MNIDPWTTRRSLAALDAGVLESVQTLFESPEWSGPSTGLVDLDRLIGPRLPGTLLVVRGCAGSGRSTMLITAALASARRGVRTTLVSAKDSHDEIGLRMLAARSAVDIDRLRKGWLREPDWREVGRAIATDLPIELVSTKLPFLRQVVRVGLRSCPALLLVDDAPHAPLLSALQGVGLTAFDPIWSAVRSAPCAVVVATDDHTSAGLTTIADVVINVELAIPSGTTRHVTLTVTKNRAGPTGAVTAMLRHAGGAFVNVATSIETGDPPTADESE